MCLIDDHKEPCDQYDPDWENWHGMCSGFGDGPKCKTCGRREGIHLYQEYDRVFGGRS